MAMMIPETMLEFGPQGREEFTDIFHLVEERTDGQTT